MISQPAVSVIMAVYNGAEYVEDAIESILEQTCSDFEFIIINDGSTDRTHEIICKYNDPRIRLINQENTGLTRALNVGLSLARGRYIARIDADDISLPERLEKQVALFEKNKDVVLQGSLFCLINVKNGRLYFKHLPNTERKLRLFLALRGTPFRHSTVMFRRSVVEKVGVYNEKYVTAQDYEYWIRIAAQHRIAMLPEYLCLARDNIDESIVSSRSRRNQLALLIRLKKEAFRNLRISRIYIIPSFAFTLASILPKNLFRYGIVAKMSSIITRMAGKSSSETPKNKEGIICLAERLIKSKDI